jgi:hypothetical protein
MEFGFVIIGIISVIVFLVVMGARARQRENLSKAFLALARKHHGLYRRTGAIEQFVEFRREGVRYRLAIERRRRWIPVYATVIEVTGWGAAELNATIRPRQLTDLFRLGSVGSGSIAFNMKYLVLGGPRERLKKLLSLGVRARISLLRQAAQSKNLVIHLDDSEFRVSRRGCLLPFSNLDRFCDAAIWLCDEMVGVLAVGIDFGQPAQISTEEAMCKICGDDLSEDVVYCRKCETPHHKDCWIFNGECSVYACGERRFRKAKPASLQAT